MCKNRLKVELESPVGTIDPRLHGQFIEHLGTCIYDGIWAKTDGSEGSGLRETVVEALAAIAPPVVRWPGGCFADQYAWEDGVGPRGQRPVRVANRWGRDEVETNAFGTHEFMELCRRIGAEPWLNGNVATGSARAMRDWVEYCNFRGDTTRTQERRDNGAPEPFGIFYWGIGNEPWDCGGKFTPREYANAFRLFESSLPNYQHAPLYLIGAGPDGNKPHEREIWTQEFFEQIFAWRRPRLAGYDLHFYTWNSAHEAGRALEFDVADWYYLIHRNMQLEPVIVRQREIMDGFDPKRQVDLIVGEWGIWHPAEKGWPLFWRQSTLRDAVCAALTLDMFHRHADTVKMACLAQTVNVLGSLLLTQGDAVIKTPIYHVFAMYKDHRGGESLAVELKSEEVVFQADTGTATMPALWAAASRLDGVLTLTVVNINCERSLKVDLELPVDADEMTVTELTDACLQAHNSADEPERLVPSVRRLPMESQTVRHTFPAASITKLRMEGWRQDGRSSGKQ